MAKPKKRRRDRRKWMDPRYRSPNYPEFVERRSGRDRRREAGTLEESLLEKIGGQRRWVIIVGLAGLAVGIYLFLLCFLGVKSAGR
ncbi:MAG: hypothetical protein AB1641_12730 [Thermodesulfobacteriota bacterium]